jgi:hypothetical protein
MRHYTQQNACAIVLAQCCIVVLVSKFSFGVWDRTQQVAKAIRSSLGFSSYAALRHMHQRWWQCGRTRIRFQKKITTNNFLTKISHGDKLMASGQRGL